ncbi:phosphodiesterase [Actinoplanes friuliensis]|uniref:Metallophosphoesterase n=1 Tax=Actinoplanes friuliensis DSM 7358 TaxID=1246995 RepID=U5WB60_9ACTN|nr:phosphodiesterase [Actinoplanes friuliensis]AGZ46227.1 metallophosphoesterase [Actinoplanes friuliensis DSM 7358]
MTSFIAQLSDSHITTGPLSGGPAAGLQLALARVMALDPRPDCVVITGDLTDHGRPDEYAALREIIGSFPLPLHLTTGNHDDRVALLDVFGGEAYYLVEYPEFTVVALDSLIPGSPAGELGAEQLAWLDQVLGRRPGMPVLIGLHHPPVPVGIRFLDNMRLRDGETLREVVSGHSNVVRVMAGHVHRTITTGFAGSLLTIAPSLWRQAGLLFNSDEPPGYLAEPTGFLLHMIDGPDCVTHTVPVSHTAALLGAY